MARTIRTKVYKFEELSKEAKQKAIDDNRDINTDYEWYDSVYEDLKELCKTIGIDVDLKQTYFTGFYTQSSGSSFVAYIDVKKCLQSIKDEKYKEYAPQDKLQFYTVSDNMIRLAYLCYCRIETSNRESSVKIDFSSDTYGNHPNIDAVITEIENFLEDVASTINHWFFNQLQTEYDYQSSDESIKETITANEYEFTQDGRRF